MNGLDSPPLKKLGIPTLWGTGGRGLDCLKNVIFDREGGERNFMALTKLEESLIRAIEATREISRYERELVSKYVELGRIWERLGEDIDENGVMIDVVNGSSTFHKVNPAVQERGKVLTSMNSILKTLGIDAKGLNDNPPIEKGGGLLDK